MKRNVEGLKMTTAQMDREIESKPVEAKDSRDKADRPRDQATRRSRRSDVRWWDFFSLPQA
jgi:hypothetical protein